MENNIKMYWNELITYMTKEQCFLFFLYLSLTAYLKNKQGERVIKKDEMVGIEDLKQLREIFKSISGYELKRAANDFEESITWEVFETRQACNMVARSLANTLEDFIINVVRLEEVIEILQSLVSELDNLMFTPSCVNRLISAIPINEGTCSVAELYCGLSGTGLEIWGELSKRNNRVILIGEEKRKIYCDISRIRMFCHGIEKPQVFERDILREDKKTVFDLVVADLPKGNNESTLVDKRDGFFGDKEKVYMEWIALQKILQRVSAGGKAIIIVTKGALVRRREQSIRETLTNMDWLEAVITIPANMYASTHLGFEILVLNKKKTFPYKNHVFFADISEQYIRQGSLYTIKEDVTKKLKEVYENPEEGSQFSTVVSMEMLRENEYSWNPLLYLRLQKTKEKWENTIELGQIADIMRGAQITKEEERMLSERATHYWLNIRNIEDGEIFFDETSMLRAKSGDWEEKFGLIEDDIIITSKGAAMKVCMVESDAPPAFLCGNLTRIRVNQGKYSPHILFEFLQSKEGRVVLESIQSGTTIKVLSNTSLKKMPIPVYDNVLEEGKQLKKAYLEYRADEKRIRNRFQTRRSQILDKLKKREREK